MVVEERSSVIDIYKGIGIILVLMGHVGFGDVSSHIAHAFHMPMFFLISGFLYNESKGVGINSWINRKSKGLLYPYLIFGIINYVVYVLLQILRGEEVKITHLSHMFFVNTTGMISGSLWFLTALLVANILFYIIINKFDKIWMRNLIIIIVSFSGIVFAKCLPFRLPYAIDAGMVGTGMQYVGYLMRKNMQYKRVNCMFNLSISRIICGSIIVSGLILLNGEINMRNGIYHNVLFFWINAIAASVLIYNISMHLDKWRECRLFVINKGIKIIAGIGVNSLIYVGLNDIIIVEIKKILQMVFVGESRGLTVIVHVLTLIITIGVIDLIIQYTPLIILLKDLKNRSVIKSSGVMSSEK